jgi:vacuolar-type H+-ATPase subunit C/Vma6
MRAVSDDTGYGFAVGRVRSLETGLFDRARWDRLVRARDAAELRALIADTAYSRHVVEGEAGIEDLLARAAADNFDFLARYCRDEEVLDIFRLRADVHNLKLAAKAMLAGLEGWSRHRLGFGRWGDDQLGALAAAADRARPERFRAAVAEARRAWDDAPAPALLDTLLDRAAQAEMLAIADGNDFLGGYLAIVADTRNLVALVRVRLLGEDRAALATALLPGGKIAAPRLLALHGEDWDAVAARFRLTACGRMMEEGVAAVVADRSVVRLERLARELELGWLARARHLTFGFEPLVGFYLFRENEITNLRRLHAAKTAGLDEAACGELVAHVA